MILQSARARENDDSGFTLVELMIYSILLIVIMGIAAALFIQMITVQRDVRAMTEANTTAQLAFKQVEDDLRNAFWATTSANGKLLLMQVRQATPADPDGVVCVGYYYNSSTETLLRSRTVAATNNAAVRAATTDAGRNAATANWTPTREGMGPIGSTRIFGPVDHTVVSPENVVINLRADTIEGRQPVEFSKTVSLRPQGSVTMSC